MGTLKKLKTKLKQDRHFSGTLLRSPQNEILIDLDGDREADLALLDTTGTGDIDILAIDLTGDGEFDLYIGDTDENGVPDMVLYNENGIGKKHPEELEHTLLTAASLVRTAVITGDYISDTLEEKLDVLNRQIRQTQSEMRNRRKPTL